MLRGCSFLVLCERSCLLCIRWPGFILRMLLCFLNFYCFFTIKSTGAVFLTNSLFFRCIYKGPICFGFINKINCYNIQSITFWYLKPWTSLLNLLRRDNDLFVYFHSLQLTRCDVFSRVTMVKHNNVIPNGHFKKHWQNYVKTWFNQPARKTRRRNGQLFAIMIINLHICQ